MCLRNVNCTKHVFFYISKDTEKFTALPEEMLKVRKKESNVLVEAGWSETVGNKESEEKFDCLRCHGESDECGAIMTVKTRSMPAEIKDVKPERDVFLLTPLDLLKLKKYGIVLKISELN